MAFDLSDIACDPDLGTIVTVIRTTGAFGAGGWIPGTPTEFQVACVFVPAEDEALSQVPEGDRVIGAMQYVGNTEIFHTDASLGQISDKIRWQGKVYRVVSVGTYNDFGFWTAVAVLMAGA